MHSHAAQPYPVTELECYCIHDRSRWFSRSTNPLFRSPSYAFKAKIYLWIVAHHLETFSIAIFPRIRLNRRKENIPLRASRHDLNLISKFKKDTIFALINYISFQLHLNQWLSFLFQNLPIFFQLSYRPYAYSIEDYRLDSCSQSSKRVQTFLRPRWLSFDLQNQAPISFRVSYQLRLEIRISLP